MSRWGIFATAVDRDLVGFYQTEAELNAGDSGLKKRFRNILAMEDGLKANGGEGGKEVQNQNTEWVF